MVFTFQPPFFAGLSGYIAEIGAGLCCADLGLPNVLHDSHASYVGHWLGILRGDTTAIIHAAAKAEQAFAYLRSFGAESKASPAAGRCDRTRGGGRRPGHGPPERRR